MSLRICRPVFLAVLLALAFGPTHAQTGPPPIKMGLWQANLTQTMTGMDLSPRIIAKLKAMGRPTPGTSNTMVRNCYTAEEWKKSLAGMQSAGDKSCTRTNIVQDTHHLSLDMACVDENKKPTMAGHMEMLFDSAEKMRGAMTMKGLQPGPQGNPISVDMKIDSHFVSTNCGDVKPGEGKLLSTR